jgi:ribosomal protein S18 acetylase RimI-like enzyme
MITQLSGSELRASVRDLAELLVDAVDGGASLGFLAPLELPEALDWWQAAVADHDLILLVARNDERIVGTVGIVRGTTPNGRHRGEIVKLIVHRDARGQGLGRKLLATAEQAAFGAGLTLLMLDTEADSPAEHLYRSAGWSPYGVVPGYAINPAGILRPCSFYFKQLA